MTYFFIILKIFCCKVPNSQVSSWLTPCLTDHVFCKGLSVQFYDVTSFFALMQMADFHVEVSEGMRSTEKRVKVSEGKVMQVPTTLIDWKCFLKIWTQQQMVKQS